MSLPGQVGHGQPADASRAPARVSWLVLAVAEEALSSGEPSMPTAMSCKERVKRSCPLLLKGPEKWGTPRSCVRGQLRASQRLSRRAAKAEGPKADKRGGSRRDALRGSRVVAVKKAAAWEGKESNAKIPERNPLSTSGALTHLPRVTLVLRGRPCGPTEPACSLSAPH